MKERFRIENIDSERKLDLLEMVTQPATEQLAEAPSPRFIKTHLPMSLLPPKVLETAKVVYVARDPRDVVVSFYHLNRLIRTQGYNGDFRTYWNYFIKDLRKYAANSELLCFIHLWKQFISFCFIVDHWTPFFDHLKEAWDKRHNPNMLFLFYEELSKVRYLSQKRT